MVRGMSLTLRHVINREDVHGPSEVIDAGAFDWKETNWRGRPWEEAVIYELHVGTFTASGTFSSAIGRFDYLADLGLPRSN